MRDAVARALPALIVVAAGAALEAITRANADRARQRGAFLARQPALLPA